MLETNADLAIVVGGYNSSNTSHLVEFCEEKLPTYFISMKKKFFSKEILHYNFHTKEELLTHSLSSFKRTCQNSYYQWGFLPGCIGGRSDQ